MPVSDRTAASGSFEADSSVPTSTASAPAWPSSSTSFRDRTPLSATATISLGMSGSSRREVSGSIQRLQILLLTRSGAHESEREIDSSSSGTSTESRCRHCRGSNEPWSRAVERPGDTSRRTRRGLRLRGWDRLDVKIFLQRGMPRPPGPARGHRWSTEVSGLRKDEMPLRLGFVGGDPLREASPR